jgi:hypothetical protein
MIGLALAVQGQWAEAGQLLSQAVPALERSSEWREWCRVVGYVGISVVARGDYHRGAAEAQRALDRALELSDQAIIGSNHILLCVTHVLNERMEALAATARSRSRRPSGQASRSSSTPVSPSGLGQRKAQPPCGRPPATWNSPTPSVLVWVGSSSPIGSPVARADTALAAGHRRSPDPRTASGGHYLPAAHAQLIPGRLCRDRQDTAAALGHAQKAAHQFAASQLDDELRQTRTLIAEIADQSSQYGRALSS